jgi:hypothetical protein
MAPPPFHIPVGPLGLGIELFYTIIVIVFCLLIYYRTKELYELTKHRGIQFFRYAFLFFGLAYASRLLIHMFMFANFIMFEPFRHPRPLLPVSNLIMAYLSTIAILYLIYSTIWKKISIEHFLTFSNLIALLIAVIAFVSMSPFIVSLVQFLLLAVTIIISFKAYKKEKKHTHTRGLYLLIAVFWLISLFVIDTPRQFLPFGLKVSLQVISMIVFFAIYYKVAKWVK